PPVAGGLRPGPDPLRHDPLPQYRRPLYCPSLPGAVRMTTSTYSAPADAVARRAAVRAGLKRRHMGERLFRLAGIVAIVLALGFVAILFTDVLRKGIPAFTQSNITLNVTFDPEVIKVDPAPV